MFFFYSIIQVFDIIDKSCKARDKVLQLRDLRYDEMQTRAFPLTDSC